MAEVKLTQGLVALIDDQDAERVSRYKWHIKTQTARPGVVYAQTTVRLAPGRKGKTTSLTLHRFIVEAEPGVVVDHRSGNTLDNRRENLRVTDARGNSTNVTSSKNQKRGGFKGVSWNRNAGKWEVAICAGEHRLNGKRKKLHLGLYDDPRAAARVYDSAAREHFGEYARLNFPGDTDANS